MRHHLLTVQMAATSRHNCEKSRANGGRNFRKQSTLVLTPWLKKMMFTSTIKHHLKVIICIGVFVLVVINLFNLTTAGRLHRLLFHRLNFFKNRETAVATDPWQNISLGCIIINRTLQSFKDTVSNSNFTDDLLVNLSTTDRPVSEVTEFSGYFQNLTYFQKKQTPISKIPSTFKISCEAICALDPMEMLIILMSLPGETKTRLDIRTTWASQLYGGSWYQNEIVRMAFFFGGAGLRIDEVRALKLESDQYGDIVVADFQESYQNLSLKLATSLTWTVQHCPRAKYVAKIDTDVFAHVPMLLQFVRNISQFHTHFVVGRQHGSTKPGVTRAGRWAVSQDVYPLNVFPKYIYGHSYVISSPAVQLMVKRFPYVAIVPNEDAFITGIMAKMLNITRLSSNVFAYSLTKYSVCDFTYRNFVTAMCKPEFLQHVWQSMSSGSCSKTVVSEFS
ncbi:unnamed protein product [Lymnaea stagnalis]|uniref:Hexosyltransferase n=1 Tax=Lymnaea stagnalis TaxID=6523 RepID=A0AAV2HAH5_LYMST